MPVSAPSSDAFAPSADVFAEFIALTTDWVWECDRDARYTYASRRVLDVLGYEPSEVIGKTACDLSAPEDVPFVREQLHSLLAEPRPFAHIELPGLHRDGRKIELEVSGVPVLDCAGRLTGYRGVVRDVTERESHRRESQRLAMAIEHTRDVVMITDRDGHIEYVNPAFEAVTGHARDAVRGLTPRILRSGRQSKDFYDQLWGELNDGRTWAGHFTNLRSNGISYETDATISPIFDSRGGITGYVAVQRDVTEQLALVNRLRAAVEMERLGKLIGAVAHEVRNPLNAIQGAAAALELDFGGDPDSKPLFDVVRSQVQRLAQLMRDLLVIGKPRSYELHARPVRECLDEAVSLWRSGQSGADVDRVTVACDIDVEVTVDSLRMQQVIVNLLDNAVQHSRPGAEIALHVSQVGSECRIAMIDRGSGIAPAHLGRVFEPFFTTRASGTGLGLSLVRSIVEQHGGTFRLFNNEPPPGCSAEILLPIARKEGACSRSF